MSSLKIHNFLSELLKELPFPERYLRLTLLFKLSRKSCLLLFRKLVSLMKHSGPVCCHIHPWHCEAWVLGTTHRAFLHKLTAAPWGGAIGTLRDEEAEATQVKSEPFALFWSIPYGLVLNAVSSKTSPPCLRGTPVSHGVCEVRSMNECIGRWRSLSEEVGVWFYKSANGNVTQMGLIISSYFFSFSGSLFWQAWQCQSPLFNLCTPSFLTISLFWLSWVLLLHGLFSSCSTHASHCLA